MEKRNEIITARSKEMLNLVYNLHWANRMAEKLGEPKRKFNWKHFRFEWSQELILFTKDDDVEYVHNFGGDRTEKTTWTYIDICGNRLIKIYCAEKGKQSEGFREWSQQFKLWA